MAPTLQRGTVMTTKSPSQSQPKASGFAVDIDKIRLRARQHIKEGAVTDGYKAQRETVLRLLNEALATEIVCVLRYKRHYFMSSQLGGIAGFAITEELGAHAAEEQAHADKLAERIC